MSNWEYKTLVYAIEGKVVYSLRFWADSARKAYGPLLAPRRLPLLSIRHSRFDPVA